jgi:hypothetical protein
MDIELSMRTKEMMDALMAPVQRQDQVFPPADATSSLWFFEIITILQMLSLLSPLQQKLDPLYEFGDLIEAGMMKAKEKCKAMEDEEAQLETEIAEGETVLLSLILQYNLMNLPWQRESESKISGKRSSEWRI